MTDYPQGDGDPECPRCKGRGVIPVPRDEDDPPDWRGERTQPCPCVYIRDVARNIERGWRGLLKADPVPDSPLKKEGRTESDLLITATHYSFRCHLKHVAGRMPSNWGFLVVTDADMMDAWLSPRVKVRDADVDLIRQQRAAARKYDALVDLVEPPELLVVLVGVKAARNEAMPEVLLEALQHRAHLSKPTWVVDHPDKPLQDGHISYSHSVGQFLSDWSRIELERSDNDPPEVPPGRSLADVTQKATAAPVVFGEDGTVTMGEYKSSSPEPESSSENDKNDDLLTTVMGTTYDGARPFHIDERDPNDRKKSRRRWKK